MTRKRKTAQAKPQHFAIALADGQFVADVTYPPFAQDQKIHKKLIKHWLESPGLRVAQSCKMVFGPEPFRWSNRESANHCLCLMSMGWADDGDGLGHLTYSAEEPIKSASVIELPYDEAWQAPRILTGPIAAEEEFEEEAGEQVQPKPKKKRAPKAEEAEQVSLFGSTG